MDTASEQERVEAQEVFDSAKKDLKDALAAFRQRKLRGDGRQAVMRQVMDPVRVANRTLHVPELLAERALKKAVPSSELALGQRPDCTIIEFADNAAEFLNNASFAKRATLDLLAAFGAEIDSDPAARIVPTPFCFITGSGHQWFLDTVRQLMVRPRNKRSGKLCLSRSAIVTRSSPCVGIHSMIGAMQ